MAAPTAGKMCKENLPRIQLCILVWYGCDAQALQVHIERIDAAIAQHEVNSRVKKDARIFASFKSYSVALNLCILLELFVRCKVVLMNVVQCYFCNFVPR